MAYRQKISQDTTTSIPGGVPTIGKVISLIKQQINHQQFDFYELETFEVTKVLVDYEDLPKQKDGHPDYSYYGADGNIRNDDGSSSYGNSYSAGDIIGVALDLTNMNLYFSKNGTWQDSGDPTSGASKTNAANNQPSYGSAISGTMFFACSFHFLSILIFI